MKSLDRKVKIPAFLHELHGHQASVFDLLINYASGIITTIIILYMAWEIPLPTYKFILLGFLAMDLAGGVVSNFTQGTNDYYAESPTRRYLFIALHIVQPLLLLWIFPTDAMGIGLIAAYTIIAMIMVNSMAEPLRQRVYASFLMTMGITLSFLIDFEQPIVVLMLLLFIIKLIVAFAVRWR